MGVVMIMVVIACLAVLMVMVAVRAIVPVMVVAMVGMIVVVIMMMIVAVMAMVMMRMAVLMVRVIVGMPAAGIGAAFGIERRFDLDHARAKAAHHLLDHMIAADAQALGHDLHRQMPVAEVPGDADEMHGVAAADFEQRLGRGDHLDQPAVLKHQRVAAAQRDDLGQVEQELQPARAGHRHAAAMPVVELEHNRIGRLLAPGLRSFDGRGAQHR
jgi:hypothetical protein